MATGLHPKVSAAVVAGALTSMIVSELNRRGVTIAADEASALTVLLSFVAGWFVPNGDNGANGAAPPVPPTLPAN